MQSFVGENLMNKSEIRRLQMRKAGTHIRFCSRIRKEFFALPDQIRSIHQTCWRPEDRQWRKKLGTADFPARNNLRFIRKSGKPTIRSASSAAQLVRSDYPDRRIGLSKINHLLNTLGTNKIVA